jgi:hypothetical protein
MIKIYLKYLILFYILINVCFGDTNYYGPDSYQMNNLEEFNNIFENDRFPKGQRSWMDTARNFINTPGGIMATQMIKEYISRSGGNQVLSLNLSNLLILLLLKSLVFAAGTSN